MNQNDINNTQVILTDAETDALGEIGNICMGTSATTLNTLLGRRVSITTPHVIFPGTVSHYQGQDEMYVAAMVDYTTGIEGYNLFLLKKEDAKRITDLLMGGDGASLPAEEVDSLYLSAISEVINQMVGSSATAMSNILEDIVNISPPSISEIALNDENINQMIGQDHQPHVYIAFNMDIEGLLSSEIMQIMPSDFAKKLAASLIEGQQPQEEQQAPQTTPQQVQAEPAAAPMAQPQQAATASATTSQQEVSRVGVKAVQYPSFDEVPTDGAYEKDNLDLIMDVPLQVSVELGKTKKSIKEVMSLSMGSVIVLDRLAGEMVDVVVNGKMFARGEVVVIDDKYGVRISDIVAKPSFE